MNEQIDIDLLRFIFKQWFNYSPCWRKKFASDAILAAKASIEEGEQSKLLPTPSKPQANPKKTPSKKKMQYISLDLYFADLDFDGPEHPSWEQIKRKIQKANNIKQKK